MCPLAFKRPKVLLYYLLKHIHHQTMSESSIVLDWYKASFHGYRPGFRKRSWWGATPLARWVAISPGKPYLIIEPQISRLRPPSPARTPMTSLVGEGTPARRGEVTSWRSGRRTIRRAKSRFLIGQSL